MEHAFWPPFDVTLTEGDLSMRVVRDEDLPELIEVALAGVHAPQAMPFAHPWTDVEPDRLPAEYARFHWGARSRLTPAAWTLEFVVRVDGRVVGCQGLFGTDFPVERQAETGSWLGREFQGRGIGTRMRRAICAFAFETLGARRITSAAFADNPASLGVSRRVGYVENGRDRVLRRGAEAESIRLLLTPEAFVPGAPVRIDGAARLPGFLGL